MPKPKDMTVEEWRAHRAVYMREWQAKHRDHLKAWRKKRREERGEEALAKRRDYRERNREHINEQQRTEYRRNWDRYRTYAQKYRANETPEMREARLAYYREWQGKRRLEQRGLDAAQYEVMLEAQGGLCAICRRPETRLGPKGRVRALAIDHDHETDDVRGLLCSACNLVLGYARDDEAILRAAVEYLTAARRRRLRPVEDGGA